MPRKPFSVDFSRGRLSPLLAAAVEKVAKLKIFETMIQNSGLRQINIAASAAYQSNCCAKFDGPDFFNSHGYSRTFKPLTLTFRSSPMTGQGSGANDDLGPLQIMVRALALEGGGRGWSINI